MNHSRQQETLGGAGLGLRRCFIDEFLEAAPQGVDFLEVAPENWIGVGGALGRRFREASERYPVICHGLSLNVGGQRPLDRAFLARLKPFLDRHGSPLYSEHLSYCGDDGLLYDLMPLPFSTEAVHHVAGRIRQVQDQLERRIAIENVSYYARTGHELEEHEFIAAVVEEADCDLLLDVNNVYVNAFNHGYDPRAFINAMPAGRLAYIHVAGHYRESEELIIDTHGATVLPTVWELLRYTYDRFGAVPTLLERDFNIPPLAELLAEVATIADLQAQWSARHEPRQHYA